MFGGKFTLDAGGNDIKTKIKGLGGTTQIETDAFVEAGHSLAGWSSKVKGTKITQPVPATDTYHGSGTSTTVTLGKSLKFGPVDQKFGVQTVAMDTLGKYQDRSTAQLSSNSNYNLTKALQLQLKLSSKKTTYALLDPLKNQAEVSTIGIGSFGLSYKFTPKMIVNLGTKKQQQTSNVASKVYQTNQKAVFSAMVIF